MPLIVEYAAATDLGSVRDHNEDSLLLPSKVIAGVPRFQSDEVISMPVTAPLMFAVADGMGGHASGEDASRYVLERIANHPDQFVSGPLAQTAMTETHHSLNRLGLETGRKGMGTTLVLLSVGPETAYVLNIGDSRCYRVRSYAAQLTRDHSLQAQTGDSSVAKNIITSCVGGGTPDMTIDIFDQTDKVFPGDVYVLCSDGLMDGGISEDMLEEKLSAPDADLKTATRGLVKAAIDGGSQDNVTVVVVRVKEMGTST